MRAMEKSRDFGIRVEVDDFRGWFDKVKHFFEQKELLAMQSKLGTKATLSFLSYGSIIF